MTSIIGVVFISIIGAPSSLPPLIAIIRKLLNSLRRSTSVPPTGSGCGDETDLDEARRICIV